MHGRWSSLKEIAKGTILFQNISSALDIDTDQDQYKSQMSKWDNIQVKRHKELERACAIMGHNVSRQDKYSLSKNTKRHIVVDDKHNFLFCFIPKVACTNWLRVIEFISGKLGVAHMDDIQAVHGTGRRAITRLLEIRSANGTSYRLQNYFKFLFVREPMERLLSAFIDKFTKPQSHIWKNYASKILYHAGRNKRNRTIPIMFSEFVQFILINMSAADQHWDTYHSLCDPCVVKYDYIAKYETLEEEAGIILSKLGLDDEVTFPTRRSTGYTHKRTAEIMEGYYMSLSKELRQRLLDVYKYEYLSFGFDIPDFLLN